MWREFWELTDGQREYAKRYYRLWFTQGDFDRYLWRPAHARWVYCMLKPEHWPRIPG